MKEKKDISVELARKTLELLVSRRLPPTPDNYTRVYAEISGKNINHLLYVEPLQQGLVNFIEYHPRFTELQQPLIKAIKTGEWDSCFEAVNTYALRLQRAATPSVANHVSANITQPLPDFAELLAVTLQNAFATLPEQQGDVHKLVQAVKGVKSQRQLEALSVAIQHFCNKAQLENSNQHRIQDGLLRLLRLLVQNVDGMVEDEAWLHGQIMVLREIIDKPIDRAAISDAERGLRDAIVQQGLLKNSVNNTQAELKGLMNSFVDQLEEISDSTGDYQNKIEGYSERIGKSADIEDLGGVLNDIMQDTHKVQSSVARSRQELLETREQAQQAEVKIRELERELAHASEMVHKDQLTGTLNRRGLEDLFMREATRADQSNTIMSVALLDLDNFKQLNDSLGHQAGDHALQHLSAVVKGCLREQDAVARYGGEEFVVIMPQTTHKQGVELVQQLQRTLTKKFFLENNNRVLLTFSAGVAQRKSHEPQDDVVARADHAMYQAKRSGKNRVFSAEVQPTRDDVSPGMGI